MGLQSQIRISWWKKLALKAGTGKSIVKNLIVSSPSSQTLTFPISYTIIGTYDITGVENYIAIKFSNFPTVGLKATVFISQVWEGL